MRWKMAASYKKLFKLLIDREMKSKELAAKAGISPATLAKMKKELFNLRFQHVTGQLETPVKMREVKREIARVKTILREKELAKAEA